MSAIATPILDVNPPVAAAPDHLLRRMLSSGRIVIGGGILTLIALTCVVTMIWTLSGGDREKKQLPHPLYYDAQRSEMEMIRHPPSLATPAHVQGERAPVLAWTTLWFGTDGLGRSMLGRCLLGGAVSLGIGLAAAAISVVLGVSVGLMAGYRGGWIDGVLMRLVDVLYGLPYVLLVILFKIALETPLTLGITRIFGEERLARWDVSPGVTANLIVLFLAIGLVSWLTMARVIRGQVLSLRAQPFIEAARASGLKEWRIFTRHLLPNLVGPIVVYASLIVPQAILQESFLSFLGIGIAAPMPTWGSLASEGLMPALNSVDSKWWLLLFPCILLAVTLLSLNFVGDGLRDVFDPRREAAKI